MRIRFSEILSALKAHPVATVSSLAAAAIFAGAKEIISGWFGSSIKWAGTMMIEVYGQDWPIALLNCWVFRAAYGALALLLLWRIGERSYQGRIDGAERAASIQLSKMDLLLLMERRAIYWRDLDEFKAVIDSFEWDLNRYKNEFSPWEKSDPVFQTKHLSAPGHHLVRIPEPGRLTFSSFQAPVFEGGLIPSNPVAMLIQPTGDHRQHSGSFYLPQVEENKHYIAANQQNIRSLERYLDMLCRVHDEHKGQIAIINRDIANRMKYCDPTD